MLKEKILRSVKFDHLFKLEFRKLLQLDIYIKRNQVSVFVLPYSLHYTICKPLNPSNPATD